MIDYLRRLDSDENTGQHIVFIARCLNLWNGVNIAGLGSDPYREEEDDAPACNSRRVLLDVLEWRDTGKVRKDFPDGYRAGEADLRIEFFKKDQVEDAAIGLWINEDPPKMIGLPQTISCSDAVLTFIIEPTGPTGAPQGRAPADCELRYSYALQAGPRIAGSSEGPIPFATSELPVTFSCDDGWMVLVDHALAPDAILGNTAAFRKWWETFGPPAPPANPSPAPPPAN